MAIEQVKPREVADLLKNLIEKGAVEGGTTAIITKQQIRRGLSRLLWRFDDIMIDVPLAPQILAQVISYLRLRHLVSGVIVT